MEREITNYATLVVAAIIVLLLHGCLVEDAEMAKALVDATDGRSACENAVSAHFADLAEAKDLPPDEELCFEVSAPDEIKGEYCLRYEGP